MTKQNKTKIQKKAWCSYCWNGTIIYLKKYDQYECGTCHRPITIEQINI